MEKVFVPLQIVGVIEKKFKRAIKKAEKLGMPVPTLEVFRNEVEVREVIHETYNKSEKINIAFVPVVFGGELPIIKGWNLAAAVEHSKVKVGETNYNTVRMVPNYEGIGDLRTVDPSCDHCGHNRFRKNTYLLHNSETNEYVRVGSTCVKDFLGDVDPSHIINSVKHLKFLDEFMDEFVGGGYGNLREEYDIKEVLTYTSAVIRKFGWMSRSKSMGGQSTADTVFEFMTAIPEWKTQEMVDLEKSINDSDKLKAQDAIDWIDSHDITDENLNDYIYNCVVLVKRKTITDKDFGVACSILSSYNNKLARESQKNVEKNLEKDSEFFGEIKERVRNIPVTFLKQWSFDSSYGLRSILKFITEDGNIIIWKTGYTDQLEVGDKLIFTGTVKNHEVYNDVKQTIMTRCLYEFVD